MRALSWRASLIGVSLVALHIAAASLALAEEAPAPARQEETAAPATANPAPAATAAAAADVVVPLPEEADSLIVDQAARPAQAEAAPAAPAQVGAASGDTTPGSSAPTLAATPPSPAVDIPPPDLPPVTVVVEPAPSPAAVAAEALQGALKAYVDGAGSGSPIAKLGKKEREALAAFYAGRAYAPLWFADAQPAPAAQAVMAQLASAADDALDPLAYPASAPATDARPADRARAEVALAAAAVAYARDARGARIEPSRLSNLITPELELPSAEEVLGGLAQATDAGQALAAWQPPHAGYKALKAKLREMREATGATRQDRDDLDGPPLRYGSSDPRVPLIRSKLSLDPKQDLVYDDELIAAVKAYQRARRMRATGIFDRRMADALSGRQRPSGSISIGDVIANMERWRWLPQDLGERHIEVNLPEFVLRLYENGQVVHRTRVVVGKTTSPTPIFSHMMDHVVVNPSWYVPPSIIKNEFLPKMAQDPNYAARQGYEVIRKGNRIFVRQPPGERNALGFIKFMFPNQHAVYLHDTPSRRLFANEQRAFSHGCVRVENPFRLADFVLGDQGFDEKRLRSLIGKGERTIRFKQPLPIHLTYFTVSVDDTGRLVRRQDLYGYDGRVETALGVSADGRRFAHNAGLSPQRQP